MKLVPDLYDGLALGAPVQHLYDVPVLTLHEEPIPSGALLIKAGARHRSIRHRAC